MHTKIKTALVSIALLSGTGLAGLANAGAAVTYSARVLDAYAALQNS